MIGCQTVAELQNKDERRGSKHAGLITFGLNGFIRVPKANVARFVDRRAGVSKTVF